jgi:hypothetical protein
MNQPSVDQYLTVTERFCRSSHAGHRSAAGRRDAAIVILAAKGVAKNQPSTDALTS